MVQCVGIELYHFITYVVCVAMTAINHHKDRHSQMNKMTLPADIRQTLSGLDGHVPDLWKD
jgi:hypothetical protein